MSPTSENATPTLDVGKRGRDHAIKQRELGCGWRFLNGTGQSACARGAALIKGHCPSTAFDFMADGGSAGDVNVVYERTNSVVKDFF